MEIVNKRLLRIGIIWLLSSVFVLLTIIVNSYFVLLLAPFLYFLGADMRGINAVRGFRRVQEQKEIIKKLNIDEIINKR
jgi:uncharacterized protein (DUF58 family)